MVLKVGINGFGRIGRLAFRELIERGQDQVQVVWINEVKGGSECAAHLATFDSIHGRWSDYELIAKDSSTLTLKSTQNASTISTIKFTEFSSPSEIQWNELNVDIVMECSGKFVKNLDVLQPHFKNSDGSSKNVKKIVVSAPVKAPGINGDKALEIVYGVNHSIYEENPAQYPVVTAASCTTNCLAPVVKVLLDTVGIKTGLMTTIHNVTNTQVVCDAPHADLRRSRSCLTSLVPTSTGSAKAIIKIFPKLEGRLNGLAVRVPLLTGSLTDFVFEPEAQGVSVQQINAALEKSSQGELNGILGYETKPLVSVDYCNDRRSGIVDALSTMCVQSSGDEHAAQLFKLLIWYDNEMGYSARMADIVLMVALSL